MDAKDLELHKLEIEERKLEGELEAKRVALEADTKLREREIQLRSLELKLRKEEIERSIWKSPIFVAIIAALAGFLSSIVAAFVEGYNANALERQKHEAAIIAERNKLESNLIIEAIKTGDTELAAKNLEFFIKLGYVEDPEGNISTLIKDQRSIPVLPASKESSTTFTPSSVFGENSLRPISSLSQDSPLKTIGSAIGRLSILSNGRVFNCTGALIEPNIVLTPSYCARDPVIIEFELGLDGKPESRSVFDVKVEPIEVDENIGFALFEVMGDPSRKFGTLGGDFGHPIKGDHLALFHAPGNGPLLVSDDEDCIVVGPDELRSHMFKHARDTVLGSSGGILVSRGSLKLIGAHYWGAGRSNAPWNKAIKLDTVVSKSKTLDARR